MKAESEGKLTWEEIAISHLRSDITRKYQLNSNVKQKSGANKVILPTGLMNGNNMNVSTLTNVNSKFDYAVLSNESSPPFALMSDEVTLDDVTTTINRMSSSRHGGPFSENVGSCARKASLGL